MNDATSITAAMMLDATSTLPIPRSATPPSSTGRVQPSAIDTGRARFWEAATSGVDQNPAKMATLPAAAAMFIRGDVPRAARHAIATPSADDWIEAGRLKGAWGLGGESFGLTKEQALTHYVGISLDGSRPAKNPDLDAPGAFSWQPGPDEKTGRVTIDAKRSKAFIGSTKAGPARLGDVTIVPKPNRQDWAAITLTAIDGPDFRSPGRFLLTATGDAGNVGMKWHDATRTTIGTDWGKGPSLVEGVPAAEERAAELGGEHRDQAVPEQGRCSLRRTFGWFSDPGAWDEPIWRTTPLC